MWTLLTYIILFLVTMTFHVISGATDKDDPNAEYFFGCSGGEFEKVKALIEADPSLAYTTTKDGEHWKVHYCFIL